MILLKLVQQLGRTDCNTSIMAIALVFVESRYCLPNGNNILVDMEFPNTRQPVLINNRPDVQNWIKTLYDKAK